MFGLSRMSGDSRPGSPSGASDDSTPDFFKCPKVHELWLIRVFKHDWRWLSTLFKGISRVKSILEIYMYFAACTLVCALKYMYLQTQTHKHKYMYFDVNKYFCPCFSDLNLPNNDKHAVSTRKHTHNVELDCWKLHVLWPNYMYLCQTTCTCANYMYFESKKKCSLLRVLIVVPVIFMTETSENTLRSPKLDGRKIDTSTCTLPNYMYFGSEKKKFLSGPSSPCSGHLYDWDTGKHPQKSISRRSKNWPQVHVLWRT